MNPGDLVMPKGTFLIRRIAGERADNLMPGILLERIPNSRDSMFSWRILWRGGRHVIFNDEFEVIDDER
jgi:hypothetical protein